MHEPQNLNNIQLNIKKIYKHWTDVTIRYSDQDPLGHVNNVAYAAYIEASRTMFIDDLLTRVNDLDVDFVLVSLKIDYLKEIRYPGTLSIGASLIRLGTKSFSTGFGVFLNNDCVATSESINVFFSLKNRKTVAIPQEARRLMTDNLIQQSKKI